MYKSPAPRHSLSRRKRLALRLSLIAAGLLAGFLIAEVGLRVAGYTFPTFYMPDNDLGYVLKPGMQGWYRKEGESYVRINSQGLRDREHAKQKPPDTLRIAILGDSYAEALQVPLESAFWSVMERRLGECPALAGHGVEAINFGVSGYGTAQELIMLRRRIWDYSPDVVLLAVTTNNDITDNARALKHTDEIPYFILRGDSLTLDNSFRQTRAFRLRRSAFARLGAWIRDNSRVVEAFHQAQYALKNYFARRRAESDAATWRTTQPPTLNSPASRKLPNDSAPGLDTTPAQIAPADIAARSDELGTDNLIYREPPDATWEDAWRVTERLILEMRAEVEAHGARFVVVTLSNGVQVHPEPAARAAFMRRVGATDLFYPDKRIGKLCERENISVVTLAPAMQVYAERNRVFLHGFGSDLGNGHWNQSGHRIAGELLAQSLCDLLAK